MKFLPNTFTAVSFFGAFVYFALQGMPLSVEPDSYWHIATGQWILEHHQLPATDPWSFTAQGQPWYLLSWVFNVIAGVVVALGGETGAYVTMLFALAIVIALLCSSLLARGTISGNAMVFTLFIATLALTELTRFRPQLIAFILAVICHRIMYQSRSDEGYGNLRIIPLLMCLWANSHGSFIVGFGLFAAYGLEALASKRYDWFKRLFVIGCVSALASLITPYGVNVIEGIRATLGSSASQYILEWLPFSFTRSTYVSAWVLLFVLSCGLRDRDIPLADKLLAVSWFLATMFAIRQTPFFIIFSAPYIAMALEAWVKQLERFTTKRTDPIVFFSNPRFRMPALLACVAAVALASPLLPVLRGSSYLVYAPRDPGAAIDYAITHLQDQRLLNDYNFGGRIIYASGGKLPVFIDGRAGTAYPESVLKDYFSLMGAANDWQAVLDRWNINAVLFGNDQRLTRLLKQSPDWKMAYTDEVASVFTRVHPSADQTPH